MCVCVGVFSTRSSHLTPRFSSSPRFLQICIGPVCVPLHLFLPFALAWLHRRGYFTFIKEEWVDYRWWKNKLFPKKKKVKPEKKVEMTETKKST